MRTAEEALERIRNDIVVRRTDESRLRSSEVNFFSYDKRRDDLINSLSANN